MDNVQINSFYSSRRNGFPCRVIGMEGNDIHVEMWSSASEEDHCTKMWVEASSLYPLTEWDDAEISSRFPEWKSWP